MGVNTEYRWPCPGCDGARKRRTGDALCKPCYLRLPGGMRRSLWATDFTAFRAALAVAVGWLDDHR